MKAEIFSKKPNPRGAFGEEYAAKILSEAGYRILAKNFSCRFGEIDLIAEKDGILAFVEVKTRKKDSMVSGAQAVTTAKQRKIIATALIYLQRYPCNLQPRFDVFCVVTGHTGQIIFHDHLTGAFDSGAYYEKYH